MSQITGIGDGAPEGWVLDEFKAPLPKGLKHIIAAIQDILKLGRIQSLHLELGKPIVYTRFIPEDESSVNHREFMKENANPGDVARNILMDEYSEGSNPQEIFFGMLLALSARRFYLTHIGIGIESRFFTWMGLDYAAYGGIEHLAGAKIMRDSELPNDVIIFYGGRRQGGHLDQAKYALKCYMFLEEDLQQEEGTNVF